MIPWRLLVDPEPRRGAWNMALDEALWLQTEEGGEDRVTVRIYGWRPPCFSVGYHQRLEETCDATYCAREGIDLVRRPTGGKAVLHDDEVTYSVVAPFGAAPFGGGGLLAAYEAIARALSDGLGRLGLAVSLEERADAPPPQGSDPCFLVPSPKELLAGGKKVAGSAQKRGRRAFLQHGALPLHVDHERLALASGRPAGDAEHFRLAFAGVADLRPGLKAEDLKRALRAGFAGAFGPNVEEDGLSTREASLAEALTRSRYATREWTEGSHGQRQGGSTPQPLADSPYP